MQVFSFCFTSIHKAFQERPHFKVVFFSRHPETCIEDYSKSWAAGAKKRAWWLRGYPESSLCLPGSINKQE